MLLESGKTFIRLRSYLWESLRRKDKTSRYPCSGEVAEYKELSHEHGTKRCSLSYTRFQRKALDEIPDEADVSDLDTKY